MPEVVKYVMCEPLKYGIAPEALGNGDIGLNTASFHHTPRKYT